jgi:LacI family transcriptional regulator
MVTMVDVARLAGVSTTTVSHVVNGTRSVSPRTAARVLAAVERTGYSQNTIARALARSRTQSVGLALSGISNPYFIDLVAAIEGEAGRADHVLLLGDTHEDPDQELQVVQALVQRRVDGLLLAPTAGASERVLRYLAAQSLPVVLVDRFVSAGLDAVGTDNEVPTGQLVDHLAELGHRRIAMIAGFPGLSTTTERIRGYRMALLRNGLAEDDALIAQTGWRDAARSATSRLLDLSDPPTALVCGANHTTIDVLHVLSERKLRVPDDIALVGFDDFDWADLFAPRLTAIRQRTREIGERAVSLLLSRIEDPTLAPRQERLSATFVHRDSCGCRHDYPTLVPATASG